MSKVRLTEITGGVTAPRGYRASGVRCGIRRERKDLALLFSEVPASAAGVFTTNRVAAAPVLVTRGKVRGGRLQAVVVNAGNANACTGRRGLEDAMAMAELAARELGIDSSLVAVASTGVIGVPLPMARLEEGIPMAVRELSPDGGPRAAEAIMTTDTVAKEAAVELELAGCTVRVGGMAKGSGMIHPNLATMLGFVTTDAPVTPECLDRMLRDAVDRSFNAVTVDGDTSTNDMVLALANGMAGVPTISGPGPEYDALQGALEAVSFSLAQQIVRDGEGATKFVEVVVKGARSREDARRAAKAVANSSLVKTALFGQDANWGRIICAVGYSGAEVEPDSIDLFLGPLQVVQGGAGIPFDEGQARDILGNREIRIEVHLGLGEYEAVVWTCDLSYDYVRINGSYRS